MSQRRKSLLDDSKKKGKEWDKKKVMLSSKYYSLAEAGMPQNNYQNSKKENVIGSRKKGNGC